MINEKQNVFLKVITLIAFAIGLVFAFSKPASSGSVLNPVDCRGHSEIHEVLKNAGHQIIRQITDPVEVVEFIEHMDDPNVDAILNYDNIRVDIHKGPDFPPNGYRALIYAQYNGFECAYYFVDFIEGEV